MRGNIGARHLTCSAKRGEGRTVVLFDLLYVWRISGGRLSLHRVGAL
ncbi:hypothetical protein ACFY1Q_11810 [Streptomyces albidoflavus]